MNKIKIEIIHEIFVEKFYDILQILLLMQTTQMIKRFLKRHLLKPSFFFKALNKQQEA